MGCSPDKPCVDEIEPADRCVLKLDLGFGSVSVELALGALAYPASGTKTDQGIG